MRSLKDNFKVSFKNVCTNVIISPTKYSIIENSPHNQEANVCGAATKISFLVQRFKLKAEQKI